MKIKWKGYCHKCKAPLDIQIIGGNSQELLGLATYLEYYTHPDFNKNQSMYKFCGPKAHKVCAQCFVNLGKMKEHYCSRTREISGKTPVLYEPSLTQEELKTWFFDELEEWIEHPISEQLMNINLKLLMSISDLGHFSNI